MSIKTLHLTNAYHASSGGIRTFYRALLDAANRHRRFVRLIVPGETDSVEHVGDYGRIYHVPAPRSPILDSRYRLMLPYMYAWPYESRLRTILAEEQPDLLEVCDKFLLCYLPGVLRRGWIPDLPIIPAIVGLSCERLDDTMAAFLSASPAAELLTKFYMRRFYAPRFDFHITASDYIADELRRVLPEHMQGRLHVAPMGVDFEWFSHRRDSAPVRANLLARLGAPETAVLLLYAGRLSKEKNLFLLPHMLAHLARVASHDFRLVIAGAGPLEHELLSALQQNAPGRSLFLGHQQRADLATLFQAVDVLVHPNPREPFGIVPLEAMAADLPVLVPAAGGVLAYANRGNAWLAEARGSCFAAALVDLVNQPAERMRRVENARRTAAALSWLHVTANYFQLYDSLYNRFEGEQFRTWPAWSGSRFGGGLGPRAA
jgi:glycosyltransferase involved in cell wall biosynthesis